MRSTPTNFSKRFILPLYRHRTKSIFGCPEGGTHCIFLKLVFLRGCMYLLGVYDEESIKIYFLNKWGRHKTNSSITSLGNAEWKEYMTISIFEHKNWKKKKKKLKIHGGFLCTFLLAKYINAFIIKSFKVKYPFFSFKAFFLWKDFVL